jgi:hypothetical protein
MSDQAATVRNASALRSLVPWLQGPLGASTAPPLLGQTISRAPKSRRSVAHGDIPIGSTALSMITAQGAF